jgi:hypothetical protein
LDKGQKDEGWKDKEKEVKGEGQKAKKTISYPI